MPKTIKNSVFLFYIIENVLSFALVIITTMICDLYYFQDI